MVDKGNEALLYIDRNLLHDGAFHAFTALAKEGRKVRKRPAGRTGWTR